MKLPTKTVASLLVVTTIAAAIPGASRLAHPTKRHESQFDKLLQRHDRKGELRAELLGIDPLEFKSMSRRLTFTQIVKKSGYRSMRAFRYALAGRLRDELIRRGWTAQQIDRYVWTRSARFV